MSSDELLRSVSRSFYLSMRFLPPAMREPVSLGYLLARLTDTIADAPGIAEEARKEALETIRVSIRDRSESIPDGWFDLPHSHAHSGEKKLLSSAGELLRQLQQIDPANRGHLEEVILTIIHGQGRDLEAFSGSSPAGCPTGEDLLRYTYWVAGCVGEFWTKVGFTTLGSEFADPGEAPDLLVRGRKLGQALQLINILRDLHEDLPAGRCYLPLDELRETGWDGESPLEANQVKPVFDRWLSLCESFLDHTGDYVGPIRNFRVRFCTRLPMLLASKTAVRLREAGIERVMREKIKVSRTEVWQAMARSVLRH